MYGNTKGVLRIEFRIFIVHESVIRRNGNEALDFQIRVSHKLAFMSKFSVTNENLIMILVSLGPATRTNLSSH